jgi:hypothetical protein
LVFRCNEIKKKCKLWDVELAVRAVEAVRNNEKGIFKTSKKQKLWWP